MDKHENFIKNLPVEEQKQYLQAYLKADQLENKKRFLPHCNFEILTTEELLIAEQEANEELIEEYASANAY